MADEHTPTTEQVRAAAESDCDWIDPPAFDRWLTAHTRAACAIAWDKAVRAMRYADGTSAHWAGYHPSQIERLVA